MITTSRTKAAAGLLAAALVATQVQAQQGPDGILQAVAISPADPATVVTSSDGRFYASSDSGGNWVISPAASMAWSIRFGPADSATDPGAAQVIYAATQDHGVMYRVDGQAWAYGDGLSGTVKAVAPHPDGRTVFAGSEDGIYMSRDQGRNWNLLSDALGPGATQGLVLDPRNPQVVYASKWGQGVYRSVDAGMTWALGNEGLFDTQVFDLDIDPGNSSVLFATTWSGIFRSVDAGASWVRLDSPARTSELAIDPLNANRLIAVTEGNGIARSENGGETWTAINEGLDGVSRFLSIAIAQQGIVYAGSFREGLFFSDDYGDNWSLVDGAISGSELPSLPPAVATPPPASAPPANATTLSVQVNNGSGPQVQLGETARFEVVVRNSGSAIAQDVEVSIGWVQVGQGDYAMNARWSGGSCSGGICRVGNLAPGQQAVVTVDGRTGDAYNWVGPFRLTTWASALNANPVSGSAQIDAVRTIVSVESGGGANGPLFLILLLSAIAFRATNRALARTA